MPKAIGIRFVEGKAGEVYYPLEKIQLPTPSPKPNEVVVTLTAAALNHRDLFIRQKLYGAISFGTPLLADGCGIVTWTGTSPSAQKWAGRRVVLNPGAGWLSDPEGPEDPKGYRILGGSKLNLDGTLAESIVIDAGELEDAPTHLSAVEAAALPLTGLTAWRATMVKAGISMQRGRNVLVTGIGGGVAVMALLFAAHSGANVYVSSSSAGKIRKAELLGAKGGVNYKDKDWEKKLIAMLPDGHKKLDAIIDGAGGDVVAKGVKLLKDGGIISSYGMTTSPKMPWLMPAVIRNIELRGSTMGSRKEFSDMINFVNDKNLRPVVSRSVRGIDNLEGIDSLFEDMKNSSQFGKLCIELAGDQEVKSRL